MTVQPVALTEEDARRLTERIRTALDRVSTAWADLAERITEAYQRRADLALGYGSWAEYAEAELKPSEGLAADVRRQLVGMLSAQGMSTRAIAPTVGVSQQAVVKALRHPDVTTKLSPAEPESLDEYRGRVLADAEATGKVIKLTGPESVADPTPAKVVGLDGKAYTRPEPKAQASRRRPLVDTASDVGWELRRAVERAERVLGDDRYPNNKDEVATRLRGHLMNAIEVCQDLMNQLPHPKEQENQS